MPAPDLSQRSRFTELNRLPVSMRLGNYTGEMLSWGFLGERWWRNYLHVHSFYEVCFAIGGHGVFHMDGVDYDVRAGDVFVAKPSEPHEIVSSEDAPLVIYFWSYTLAPPDRNAINTAGELDQLMSAFAASRVWVSRHAPGMLRTLELLTEEVVAHEPGYRHTIAALASKLLIDTARAVVDAPIVDGAPEAPPRAEADVLVQRMARYLRDNFGRAVQIRDVAAQVHLSERHTSRLFHKVMGVSIKDYVMRLRLNTASRLLLEGRLTIKEVAEASGFPDVQHFTTVFGHHIGLTPAAFRKQRGTRFVNELGLGHVEAATFSLAKSADER